MTTDLEDRIRTSLRHRAETIQVDVPEPDLARAFVSKNRPRRIELAAVAAALVLFVAAGLFIALAGRGSSPTLTTQVTGDGSLICHEPQPTLVIYMRTDASASDIAGVDQYLRTAVGVESYFYLDQAATYAEYVEQFADSPGMVASVTPPDLPTSFRVIAPEPISRALATTGLSGVKAAITMPCSDHPH